MSKRKKQERKGCFQELVDLAAGSDGGGLSCLIYTLLLLTLPFYVSWSAKSKGLPPVVIYAVWLVLLAIFALAVARFGWLDDNAIALWTLIASYLLGSLGLYLGGWWAARKRKG